MWFSASLMFSRESSSSDPLWEESIIVLEASSVQEAESNAKSIGERNEVSFEVEDGTTATWKFVQVERVCEIDEGRIVSGTEIFSRFLRDSEAQSILTPFDD